MRMTRWLPQSCTLLSPLAFNSRLLTADVCLSPIQLDVAHVARAPLMTGLPKKQCLQGLTQACLALQI